MSARSVTLLTVVACLMLCHSALASCAPPKGAGAVICFPTNNAKVTGSFNIEGAATAENGLPIKAMILYVDNQKIAAFNADQFVLPYQDGFSNGSHHAVLNAWDSEGHLYQTSGNFTYLTGMCLPSANGVYPEIEVPIIFTGSSAIKTAAVYANNTLLFTFGNGSARSGINYTPSGSPFKMTIVGYDSAGKAAGVVTVNNLLTYYDGACIRNCDPGLTISAPAQVTDQGTSFTITGDTTTNPHPIVSMRVYLDTTSVLTSTGPAITGTVKAAPGTHLITVQAWDTEGALYKSQESVNVQ